MGVFGEKLRKQREQRGLEIDAISNTTKISPRMLRALEDEHFDQLPGGVFNKGFVRAYARQVGLNEEEAIADYLDALRENQIQQQSILPDFRAPTGKPGAASSSPAAINPDASGRFSSPDSPPRNHAVDLRSAQLVENDAHNSIQQEGVPFKADHLEQKDKDEDRPHHDAVSFPTQGFITGPAIEPQSIASNSQVPWRKLAAGLLAIILLLALWNLRRHAHPPVASGGPSVPASAPVPVVSTPQAPPQAISAGSANAVKPNQEKSSAAAVKPSIKPSPKRAAEPSASRHHAAAKLAIVPKPPKTFTLLIRAAKTTWVSIFADGKPVAHETLIAPAHTSVRASKEIVVRVGNAANINFLLNGRAFPVSGSEGEVKTYVFNSFGYHLQPQ